MFMIDDDQSNRLVQKKQMGDTEQTKRCGQEQKHAQTIAKQQKLGGCQENPPPILKVHGGVLQLPPPLLRLV